MALTIDLQMLTWTAALCIFLMFPYTIGLVASFGVKRAASYPQPNTDELSPWIQRSKRAHLNLLENIAPFAVLVLVAHLGGMANETTALGAQIFFWARIVQAAAHTIAIPFVRTGAFAVSVVAMVMILLEII